MANTILLNARIPRDLKAQAEAVLGEMGLNMSDAIRMYLTRIVSERAIPFEVRVPNAVTIQAMDEVDRRAGLHSYNKASDILNDWHEED